jgi:hypothetical protein
MKNSQEKLKEQLDETSKALGAMSSQPPLLSTKWQIVFWLAIIVGAVAAYYLFGK